MLIIDGVLLIQDQKFELESAVCGLWGTLQQQLQMWQRKETKQVNSISFTFLKHVSHAFQFLHSPPDMHTAQITFQEGSEGGHMASGTNQSGHSHGWEAEKKNCPFRSQQGSEGSCCWQFRIRGNILSGVMII